MNNSIHAANGTFSTNRSTINLLSIKAIAIFTAASFLVTDLAMANPLPRQAATPQVEAAQPNLAALELPNTADRKTSIQV